MSIIKHDKQRYISMIRKILIATAAVLFLAAVLFMLWWMGCFIPRWVEWNDKTFAYGDKTVCLSNRRLMVYEPDEIGTDEKEVFRTKWDWFVQDVLVYDINRDGIEELVLLVWKHGSYGKILPIWEKHNDIRLEQHIYIYQWDEKENRMRAVWMSSALDFEVSTMVQGGNNTITITDTIGQSSRWSWLDFGLKLVGDAKTRSAVFLCAGDNLIHPWILDEESDNQDDLYRQISNEVSAADFAVINQETIFVEDRALVSDFPRFGTPISVGEALIHAGFDAVTLANNHTLDYGTYGINTTIDFYEELGVTYVGAHKPGEGNLEAEEAVVFQEVNQIKTALLNYTYGTNGIKSPPEEPYIVERFRDEERMIQQIDYARMRADVVIVFAHWGEEYCMQETEEQLRLCELFLTHGVDVVIGTHPHVLQPYELKVREDGHEMLVYYSLGNLISGQDRLECLVGGLAKFTIEKAPDGTVSIVDYALEEVVTHQEAGKSATYLKSDYSEELAAQHKIAGLSAYLWDTQP